MVGLHTNLHLQKPEVQKSVPKKTKPNSVKKQKKEDEVSVCVLKWNYTALVGWESSVYESINPGILDFLQRKKGK